MSKVFRQHGNWQAVQRANRSDCVLLFSGKEMARGDKPYITRLFGQFSTLTDVVNEGKLP